MSNNYYDILGVSSNASLREITEVYRRLALQHHPDRGGSAEEFQKISEAYQKLSEELSRNNPRTFTFSGRPGSNKFKEFEEMLNEYKKGLDEVQGGINKTQEEINKGWDLIREEAIQSTERHFILYGLSSQDLNPFLWTPYGSWKEKFKKITGENIASFLNQMGNAIDEAGKKKMDKSYSSQNQWKENTTDKNREKETKRGFATKEEADEYARQKQAEDEELDKRENSQFSDNKEKNDTFTSPAPGKDSSSSSSSSSNFEQSAKVENSNSKNVQQNIEYSNSDHLNSDLLKEHQEEQKKSLESLKKQLNELQSQQSSLKSEVNQHSNQRPESNFPWKIVVPMGAIILIFGGIILYLLGKRKS